MSLETSFAFPAQIYSTFVLCSSIAASLPPTYQPPTMSRPPAALAPLQQEAGVFEEYVSQKAAALANGRVRVAWDDVLEAKNIVASPENNAAYIQRWNKVKQQLKPAVEIAERYALVYNQASMMLDGDWALVVSSFTLSNDYEHITNA